MNAPRSVCTFVLDGRRYGIDVTLVQEVVRDAVLTPVPLARPEIVGLINLRGEVLPTVDLRRVLGRPERTGAHGAMNVVARLPSGLMANLLVDVVGDVIDIDDADRDAALDGMTGPHAAYFGGSYLLDDGLVIELDLERILDELAAAAA